jgi:hypothetical protein
MHASNKKSPLLAPACSQLAVATPKARTRSSQRTSEKVAMIEARQEANAARHYY